MEQLIEFLERYWGYTLIGGMSIGTIIVSLVSSIISLLKNKVNSQHIDSLSQNVNERIDSVIAHDVTVNNLISELTEEKSMLKNEVQYLSKVNTVLFKAVSYLIVASKLPDGDKIELQNQFAELTRNVDTTIKNIEVSKVIEEIKETVASSVQHTQTLLDKYTKED